MYKTVLAVALLLTAVPQAISAEKLTAYAIVGEAEFSVQLLGIDYKHGYMSAGLAPSLVGTCAYRARVHLYLVKPELKEEAEHLIVRAPVSCAQASQVKRIVGRRFYCSGPFNLVEWRDPEGRVARREVADSFNSDGQRRCREMK
jgi:hypothetical protein